MSIYIFPEQRETKREFEGKIWELLPHGYGIIK